jgi:chitin disaccharide deacetylase
MKRIIFTGDDFGLSEAVNEAIEEAHRKGVLNSASLMIGGKAAKDAVERARRLPSLRVGLHLVFVNGSPVSPRQTIPDLLDPTGEFPARLFRAGVRFFFRPGVRRQLETEIRAQFQAFQNTSLSLDHVNCHNHMHLHPTLGGLILRIGREYGLRAIRYPYEPVLPSWRASKKDLGRKVLSRLFLSPWLALLKIRIQGARVCSNHFVFGLNDSGSMNLDLVLGFLKHLPQGVSEIYFHPAVHPSKETGDITRGDSRPAELEALTSPLLREALQSSGIETIAFSDL